MKFIFACLLIAVALYLVLNQQGAIDAVGNSIRTGRTAAQWNGR